MQTTGQMIDALIAMRAESDGDAPDHFWKLVERYRAGLVNQACAILGQQTDAEDVAQESLCQAYQDLQRLRDPNKLGHWLRAINRHNALRLAKKRRRDAEREERLPTGAQPPAHEAEHLDRQTFERLSSAVDALPDPFRDVILLRYWEHLSYEEIAQRLGVPLGTIKSRLARADRILFRRLRPYVPLTQDKTKGA